MSVCAACPTPSLNQSYELRPPWGQNLRYVPHRVRNGYGTAQVAGFHTVNSSNGLTIDTSTWQLKICLPQHRNVCCTSGGFPQFCT